MAQLSSPIGALLDHYQVVVIGSGYGGAIAASRLARAGRQVCVLERGREFQPGQYPRSKLEALGEIQVDFPPDEGGVHVGRHDGLYDFRINRDINVVVGCGLGGTSLINANVVAPPLPEVFNTRWPEPLRAKDGRLPADLEAGMALAREVLRPTPYPRSAPSLAKLQALEFSASKLGASVYRPPLAVTFDEPATGRNAFGVEQHACSCCGDCASGCNDGAKNTVIMNYLPDAKNHGAAIFTQIGVRRISRVDGRWMVHCTLAGSDREVHIGAEIVVVAAGAMGSTEILLRSRAAGLPLSDMVGHRFTGNGDVLAFGYNTDHELNAVGWGDLPRDSMRPVGPCITGLIDLRDRPQAEGMLIEEGAIPGPLANIMPKFLNLAFLIDFSLERSPGKLLEEILRKVESAVLGPHQGAVHNSVAYLGMASDDGKGTLYLDQSDRVRISWDHVGAQQIFDRLNETMRGITSELGGVFVRDPIWIKHQARGLITVHPLGGCVVADDSAQGGADHLGRVFSGPSGTAVHDGLFVADGALVASPVGINPLLTISGLAERLCAHLARERGWTIDYSLRPVGAA